MPRTKQFDETAVLDKAIDIFWEKGYSATSYSDLVEGMGINRASMYSTYGDKHALFLKALQQYKKKSHNILKQVLLKDSGPVKQKLEIFFDSAIEEALNDKACKGCFIVNATAEMATCDKEIADFTRQNQTEILGLFTFLFQEAKVNGEIASTADPEALAHFIFNTYNGLRVVSKMNVDKIVLENIKNTSLSILV